MLNTKWKAILTIMVLLGIGIAGYLWYNNYLWYDDEMSESNDEPVDQEQEEQHDEDQHNGSNDGNEDKPTTTTYSRGKLWQSCDPERNNCDRMDIHHNPLYCVTTSHETGFRCLNEDAADWSCWKETDGKREWNNETRTCDPT